MNAINLIEELRRSSKAVFTIKDIARIANKKEKYTSLMLYRLKKRKLLLDVEKGKYCLPDANILCVASNLIFPSYISYYEALSYYKSTTQIPQSIEVITTKSKKSIDFIGYTIRFVKAGKDNLWGYKKEYLNGKHLFIAEPEKLVLDCLFSNRVNLKDVLYLIKNVKIDYLKLLEYAKRLNSSIVIKRLGYLLEIIKNNLYKKLLKLKYARKYEKLNTLLPVRGIKNTNWKLIINEDVNA